MKYTLVFILLGLVFSCQDQKQNNALESGYRLVWSDEFDYKGKPDPDRWEFEEGLIRNREKQYYTAEAVYVENGHLVLEANRDTILNKKFTNTNAKKWQEKAEYVYYSSGSVTTKNKAAWQYGKIEVRAKLPEGRGLWPAIWMLGENRDEVGWPATGEIDIMEHVGFKPDSIFGTVHTKAFNHMKGTQQGKKVFIKNPYADFQTFSIEWTPQKIDFLLNDSVYNSFENRNQTEDEWPFDQKFHLKINVAVGGMLGGRKGINDSIFPQKMLVDYVRIYQKQQYE